MTTEQKAEITRICKDFAKPFIKTFGQLEGTGWLIVDPLSGYLNAAGIKHTLGQMPENKKHPQVLVLTFPDGTRFIPTGADLKPLDPAFENWIWI